jgi:hypothetical protein
MPVASDHVPSVLASKHALPNWPNFLARTDPPKKRHWCKTMAYIARMNAMSGLPIRAILIICGICSKVLERALDMLMHEYSEWHTQAPMLTKFSRAPP